MLRLHVTFSCVNVMTSKNSNRRLKLLFAFYSNLMLPIHKFIDVVNVGMHKIRILLMLSAGIKNVKSRIISIF